MIIIFAGGDAGIYRKLMLEEHVDAVLFSQFYSKNRDIQWFKDFIDQGSKVFIDSGGFTARIQGTPISVEEYAEFLERNRAGWTWCANLDVMDPEETLANQKYLESKGFDPIPVFHYSEIKLGRKDLMEYYCKNYPYVAIGGVAATVRSATIKKQYFDFCFHIALKYKTKLHGFGVTDPDSLLEYPWYSCDSTSWIAGSKYANIYKFENGGLTTTIVNKQPKDREAFLKLENPMQYIDRVGEPVTRYKKRCRQNLQAFRAFQDYVTRLWEKRGISWI